MRFFCNLSIKGKLTAIILLISILVQAVISAGLLINEIHSLKRNLQDDLFTLTNILGYNGSVGLVFGNVQATEDTLTSLKAKSSVLQARVFGLDGQVFASYLRADVAPATVNFGGNLADFQRHITTIHGKTGEVGDTPDRAIFGQDHVDVFKQIVLDGKPIGTLYIQADLREIDQRMKRYGLILGVVVVSALFLALILARTLQRVITAPIFHLRDTMSAVEQESNYTLRTHKPNDDEVGQLIDSFNRMLDTLQARDHQIQTLNHQLRAENQRMGIELDVTRRLQKMVLPKESELRRIEDLDIACVMEPAAEVGGDYYDVLYHDGQLKIGIGDVTGHGLESGVVMLMVQMAVRTLLTSQIHEPHQFLTLLNKAVFDNVQRMDSDKNLTFSMLDYRDGAVRISGQHEEVLKVHQDGRVERIDTIDLGFMVGLTSDISAFIGEVAFNLAFGEGIVLYTDGVTEARNTQRQMYGLDRLCQAIGPRWTDSTAKQMQDWILDDLKRFIGTQELIDDITLVVLKRTSQLGHVETGKFCLT